MLDAGPVIKLFSLGIWDDFIKHCDVTISRIIADDQALYTEDGKEQINLKPYEEQATIKIIDVDPCVVKRFYEKFDVLRHKYEIHDGEKETLAFLHNASENWFVCAADKAVFAVLGFLGKGTQGIFLEEILQQIGLSPSQTLRWKYTKKFREKFTRMGQVDFSQGQGLM